MKAHDSLGFFISGQVMALLSGSFTPGGLDGASTSALWLQLMGFVNTIIGAGIIAQTLPSALLNLLACQKVPAMVPQAPSQGLRPARVAFAVPHLEPEEDERIAA